MGKRFQYNKDTWSEIGIGTKTMDGAVKELKAWEASGTVTSHNTTTKIMVLAVTLTGGAYGNIRPEGQITVTDATAPNPEYVFSYDSATQDASGVATLYNVKQVTSGTFVVQAATDTFVHSETLDQREGVTVYNDAGVTIAVGFNGNIAVGGNGIQIANGGEETFPITEDIPVYAVGASGEVTIVEYK